MGCCLGCFRSQEARYERIPLNQNNQNSRIKLNPKNSSETIEPSDVKGERYYQSIVEEAQEKFLNSSKESRINRPSKEISEISKQNFITAGSTSELTISPPNKTTIDKNFHPDLLSQSRSVVNILSEPVHISAKIDIIADEIAELIANHTFKVSIDENNSTLIPFTPVNINR